jgi:hypothetical protein
MIGRLLCGLGLHWYEWYEPRLRFVCVRCRKEVRDRD